MRYNLLRLCLIVILAAGFSAPVFALDPLSWEKSWTIDYSRSRLGFSGMQGDNTAFQGFFKTFTVDADFNPENPETGKITAIVDVTSITTNDAQRDGMLPQKEWFNTERYPQARFTSKAITEAGSDENGAKVFTATGELLLKGITQPVTVRFTMTPEGDMWHVVGKARLLRTDFLIGQGQWADEQSVKFSINVSFDLYAKPKS